MKISLKLIFLMSVFILSVTACTLAGTTPAPSVSVTDTNQGWDISTTSYSSRSECDLGFDLVVKNSRGETVDTRNCLKDFSVKNQGDAHIVVIITPGESPVDVSLSHRSTVLLHDEQHFIVGNQWDPQNAFTGPSLQGSAY